MLHTTAQILIISLAWTLIAAEGADQFLTPVICAAIPVTASTRNNEHDYFAECTVTGNPQPIIEWRLGVISPDVYEVTIVNRSPETNSTTIRAKLMGVPKWEWNGLNVSCHARQNGTLSTENVTVTLQIDHAPKGIHIRRNEHKDLNGNLDLLGYMCSAKANPEAKYVWHLHERNTKTIVSSKQVIHSPLKQGIYSCTAFNRHGDMTVQMTLHQDENPNHARKRTSLVADTPWSVYWGCLLSSLLFSLVVTICLRIFNTPQRPPQRRRPHPQRPKTS